MKKTIIFQKITGKWCGVEREPRKNEIAVEVSNTDNLKKIVQKTHRYEKYNDEKQLLYLLPQETVTVEKTIKRTTTTKETDTPVIMETVVEKELDGLFKSSRVVVQTEPTDTKHMVVRNGKLTHATNEKGELLYEKQYTYGRDTKTTTLVLEEQHIKNDNGQLLYYDDIEVKEERRQPQKPLYITDKHPQWTKDLDVAVEDKAVDIVVEFNKNPNAFVLEDVIKMMANEMINMSFYNHAHIVANTRASFIKIQNATVSSNGVMIQPDGYVEFPIDLSTSDIDVVLDAKATIDVGMDDEWLIDIWDYKMDKSGVLGNKVRVTNTTGHPVTYANIAVLY